MKGPVRELFPLLFAMFTFILYLAIYQPRVNSLDFTTALLVFFTALGSAAIIVLALGEKKSLYYFYLTAAVLIPVFLTFFTNGLLRIDSDHKITVGLIMLGFLYLRAFVSGPGRDK